MRAVSIKVAVRALDSESTSEEASASETESTEPDIPCVDDSTGRQLQFAGVEQLHGMA
jgi:hypothetical protein